MLRKGMGIQAKLIEALEKDLWIVSFQGRLLQVKNSTTIEFKEGLILNLQVEKEKPLQLKILSRGKRPRQKIDLLV